LRWVLASICTMVWFTCAMPACWSCDALRMPASSSASCCTLPTISPIVVPACSACWLPWPTRATESSISP
jgi:hypothetical protein